MTTVAQFNSTFQSEQIFRSIFDQGPLGMAIVGRNLQILKVNPAFCRMLGFTEEEMTSRTVVDITHPDDLPRDVAQAKQLLNGAVSQYTIEKRYIKKNGDTVWVELRVSLIRDEGGEPIYALGAVEDISHRRDAEIALRKKEASLEEAQRIAKIGNWEWDIVTGTIIWSDETYRIMGMVPGETEPSYESFLNAIHPDDRAIVHDAVNKAVTENQPYNMDYRTTLRDGSICTNHVIGEVTYDRNGRPIRMAGTLHDITERKALEEQLRKLSRAVEQSPVCVVITNPKGLIEYVNPRFSQLTGYASSEVVGQSPRILKSGVQSAEFYQKLWKTISAGDEWRGEFCNQKKNGERYWESASICAIRDQRGEITHYLAIKEDISERKRVESDLRQSENKYRTLFEVSQDAVLMTRADGIIMEANAACVKMFGYDNIDDFLKIERAVALYQNPDERDPVIDQLLTSGFVKNHEVRLKKKDGTPVDVVLSSCAVRDEKGQISCFYGILHDITRRKKMERQLLQTQKMETIATLVGGIAHDFNNLLIIILGNIEFAIEDSPEDSPIRHYLQRVEDAAGNARDLVSKLQSFSRQQSLQPQPFNLNAAIEDTVGMLCTVVGKAIALKRYLEPQLHLIVGDVGQIQQILMNLCINARDAMSGGGEIVVTTRNVTADEVTANGRSDGVHDYVLLSVSDDGAGIETEIQPRIFEPFFTTKEIGKGTGLGLSVVYGIVQQHKGFIEIESVKGNGATFKIYFPAHVSSAPKNGKKRSRSTARKDLANYIEQERS